MKRQIEKVTNTLIYLYQTIYIIKKVREFYFVKKFEDYRILRLIYNKRDLCVCFSKNNYETRTCLRNIFELMKWFLKDKVVL